MLWDISLSAKGLRNVSDKYIWRSQEPKTWADAKEEWELEATKENRFLGSRDRGICKERETFVCLKDL